MAQHRWLEQGEIGEALRRLGWDLFTDVSEGNHHPDCPADDDDDDCWRTRGYILIGQTDQQLIWGRDSNDDPEQASVALVEAGGVPSPGQDKVANLLVSLGWRELEDNYVQSKGFYIP
mgnify:FL=1